MVECQLPKLNVAGSNPVSRSIFSSIHGLYANNGGIPDCFKLTSNIALQLAFSKKRKLLACLLMNSILF